MCFFTLTVPNNIYSIHLFNCIVICNTINARGVLRECMFENILMEFFLIRGWSNLFIKSLFDLILTCKLVRQRFFILSAMLFINEINTHFLLT